MATNFPTSLDSLTNPASTDPLNSPSHSNQHTNSNDAIEALQVKVGVNGSADTNSLDYKVSQAVTLTGTATLTNKTLTAPKFADLGFIADANGNELIIMDTVASAVNEITVANAATGGAPTITASGGDTNVSINVVSKGSGTVQANGAVVATTTGTQTLTNKSVSLGSNTVTGTTAQFNTALTDGDFATLAGTETLTNKTLTAPKFADLGFIADANGNELIIMDTTASAVNEITVANAATGNAPTITASGGDTNVSINLLPKGSGAVQVSGAPIVTTTASQTLTNKTLTSPIISTISNTGVVTLPTATDTLVGRATTDTLTNKTITLSGNTISGTVAQFNTALTDDNFVTLTGTETLTNKTLTAPRFADLGFIADANGNELIILDTVTSAVNELTVANAAAGSAPTISATGADTDVSVNIVPKNNGTVQAGGVPVVTTTGTQTLTNKTLTTPVLSAPILVSPEERWTVSATAATGTVNVDVSTTAAWLYTANASANWTFNFRGDSGTTLSSLLATGDSVTIAFAVTNGNPAFYPTAFQIDGSGITPKWQGGAAPTAGSVSSIDLYVFTIVKTAATPTYTVLAAQTKFA